ncbi:hypothetical protein TTHERM_00053940 (macronuclear) [Tetrahymena thermophila SB210]|uniref:Uncharacterized protein n=1 Tax=Tetrahymena thermophila (strain SB210) TaxID=312017 RepID=I7M0B9_TETTS|nr:hypothetical protein TTHERM_00053940 [Tetrahymena thermophila SB210]EAR87278.2 hypothetical protein TTHERM_00053940 [Tetrahymena thermophila SB210]|eukprot:XP_001007523.2 hypothetical protein TTHERM_00053940 [Tetrahymena thermophila SB210]
MLQIKPSICKGYIFSKSQSCKNTERAISQQVKNPKPIIMLYLQLFLQQLKNLEIKFYPTGFTITLIPYIIREITHTVKAQIRLLKRNVSKFSCLNFYGAFEFELFTFGIISKLAKLNSQKNVYRLEEQFAFMNSKQFVTYSKSKKLTNIQKGDNIPAEIDKTAKDAFRDY